MFNKLFRFLDWLCFDNLIFSDFLPSSEIRLIPFGRLFDYKEKSSRKVVLSLTQKKLRISLKYVRTAEITVDFLIDDELNLTNF